VRWRLLLEEFGPKLTHVKGANNMVADALSRLETAEEELSAEAFANELANEEEDFPTGHPLSYKEMAFHQKKCRALQNKFRTQPELHIKKPHAFADSTCELVTKNNEICIPKSLQHECAEWCHLTLMHPGEQRLELTMAQHCTWIGLKPACVRACKNCENCAVSKDRDQKTGLLPPKPTPETILWHALCIDLAGPQNSETKRNPKHALNFIAQQWWILQQDSSKWSRSVKRPPMQWPTGWKSTGSPDVHGLQKQLWTREVNLLEKSAKLLKTNMALNGRCNSQLVGNPLAHPTSLACRNDWGQGK